MAAITVTRGEVQAFLPGASDAIVDALIEGTLARAALLAPCLLDDDDLTDTQIAAARDILLGVIIRAVEAGSGETINIIAGPFQQGFDSQKRRNARFKPDEIRDLQALCGIKRGGAFTIVLTHDDYDYLQEDMTPFTAALLDPT